MGKNAKDQKEPTKQTVFQAEFDKLTAVFSEVEEPTRKLAEGLILDAAFLYSENWELRRLIGENGSVIVNPANHAQQKTLPAATQYLKNANSYAVVTKALNGILSKNEIKETDDMGEFE